MLEPLPLQHRDSPGLILASGEDALSSFLGSALARRFPVSGSIQAELSGWSRYLVALTTLRPTRRAWVERFFKSALAYRLRTFDAERQLHQQWREGHVVLQIHALFEVDAPSVLYVDCTHKQSARGWPAWNPLQGRALSRWYERERVQYTRAEHIFAFSEATRRSLIEDYAVPAARVTVVGAGANITSMPEISQRASPDEPPTILFVGNDFVRKGGPELLEAFGRVRDVVPDARLVVVGTPHAIPAQDGVVVLGRVRDRSALEALYLQASVFCLPTHFEPFGLALLEAMASGLACVTTDACAEIVDAEIGYVVPPGDVDALTDALVAALTDRDGTARRGAAGRERVERHYRWEQVVERMAPVLEQQLRSAP
jgi:starch synthase